MMKLAFSDWELRARGTRDPFIPILSGAASLTPTGKAIYNVPPLRSNCRSCVGVDIIHADTAASVGGVIPSENIQAKIPTSSAREVLALVSVRRPDGKEDTLEEHPKKIIPWY